MEKELAREEREHKRAKLISDLLDPVITLESTSIILGVCETTVRRYTNKGYLDCIRTPGNQRRFKLSQIAEFLAREKEKKARGRSTQISSEKQPLDPNVWWGPLVERFTQK